MYVASERPSLVKGICLLNCVGGMNQRGLYKDSWQLALMRPFFEILEWCLKRKRFASVLFSKFRCVCLSFTPDLSQHRVICVAANLRSFTHSSF